MERASQSKRRAGIIWIVVGAGLSAVTIPAYLAFLANPSAPQDGRPSVQPENWLLADTLASLVGFFLIPGICFLVGFLALGEAKRLRIQESAFDTQHPVGEADQSRYPVGTIVLELSEGTIVQKGRIVGYEDGKAHAELDDGQTWWFKDWNERFMPEDFYDAAIAGQLPTVKREHVEAPPVFQSGSQLSRISPKEFEGWKASLDSYLEGVGVSTRSSHFKPEALVYGAASKMAPDEFVKSGYNRAADLGLIQD